MYFNHGQNTFKNNKMLLHVFPTVTVSLLHTLAKYEQIFGFFNFFQHKEIIVSAKYKQRFVMPLTALVVNCCCGC